MNPEMNRENGENPQSTCPIKEQWNQEVDARSKITALEFMTAATQILTILCLVKGNPAWKGSLALLFVGAAASLFYKYDQHGEKPYLWVAIGAGMVGLALLAWFAIAG
ncbi:DUF6442 family protein [Allofournierella massiliensis]|uniref:Transmembrane protein n=1 Tax=Allofournierella massiliensis TaxID=1650663 RepID=A0A4R1R1C2_9FIRM|nr:DUF6442 family protein [Fournierella massiliensis]TCL59126.1 hypothetical protein EDD77_10639 [Fournierella massiliensis]